VNERGLGIYVDAELLFFASRLVLMLGIYDVKP